MEHVQADAVILYELLKCRFTDPGELDDIAGTVSSLLEESPELCVADHDEHLLDVYAHAPLSDGCATEVGTSSITREADARVTGTALFPFNYATVFTRCVMNPFSIMMFCFSGGLFLYAILLYTTKDYKLIPRNYAAKTGDKKSYARRVAEIVALVAVAPAHCGYVALFSMGWSVVVLIVEMVIVLWVGTKIME